MPSAPSTCHARPALQRWAEGSAQAGRRCRGDLGGFKRRREEDCADLPHAASRPLGAVRELGALRGASGGASSAGLGTLRAAGGPR